LVSKGLRFKRGQVPKESKMEYIYIIIFTVFVNNIVFSQFLGICPFLGVSGKISTSAGMAGAVMFVMTIATVVTFLIQKYILVKYGLVDSLQIVTFILVIASLVQLVEIILKKVSPALYQALGIFLPLITTNCAVLGVAILASDKDGFTLIHSVVFAIGHSMGFGLALILFAGLREHLEAMNIPKGMKGIPIALVTAGLLSMAFMGFSGLVKM
jgi:electron transport complex protein RnfA